MQCLAGSLSVKIASRGISLPFSLIYNSGVVHHATTETYYGGASVALQMDGASVPADRSINGWSDTIPYATASFFVTHLPPNPDGKPPGVVSPPHISFTDASGQSHQLGITPSKSSGDRQIANTKPSSCESLAVRALCRGESS